MEDTKDDLRLKQIIDEWTTQWLAIEHPKDISWIEKFEEYVKWRKFRNFWIDNVKGLSMPEALSAYKMLKQE